MKPRADSVLRGPPPRPSGRRLLRRSLAVAALLAAACSPQQKEAPDTGVLAHAGGASDTASQVRPARVESELTRGDTLPGHPSWTREDYEILRRTVTEAQRQGIHELPVGERVARIGETFLGTPYVPQTLDPPGPERLVVNLRGLDCVTFVETALALAYTVRVAPDDAFAPAALIPAGEAQVDVRVMALYEFALRQLRYRHGRTGGYTSRLHYFSEWIQDNEERGWVDDVTADLGGEVDPEPPTFMTAHREAYRQLEDEALFEDLSRVERELGGRTRFVIPQDRVASVQAGIRTGDVIAATSTLEGLDVAHTGIAVWKGDTLHLMHAPLVGEAVQLSEQPLAARLLGLSSQDGIMVARPLDPPEGVGSQAPSGTPSPEGGQGTPASPISPASAN